MSITINSQKVLRTGDKIINKHTGKVGVIHYVFETSGQMSFEQEVSKIESALVDDGNQISNVLINDIELLRRK